MRTVNGHVGVEPFKSTEVHTVNLGGFAKVGQKYELTPLKVVIGTYSYPPGTTLYVTGESCKAHWASKVYKVDGKEFILMPEASVVLVEYMIEEPKMDHK